MIISQNRSKQNCKDHENMICENKNIDRLLTTALTPDVWPDNALNEQILRRAKEEVQMKEEMKDHLRKRSTWSVKRTAATAAIAAAVLLIGGGTTYAAWRYLTPQEAAVELKDQKLAEAFSGEGAMLVNETQSYGSYRITLIGIVSGEELTDYARMASDGEIRSDRSYWLLAIEHADGTPMPESSSPEYDKERFLSSPFIQGVQPWNYNIFVAGGGYSEFVRDGVLYRMAECDNLELFADRNVYLCLADDDSARIFTEAYDYDASSGEITRKEDYEGCNALFTLPLDAKKADPKKAEEYLKSLDQTDVPSEVPAGNSQEEQTDEALENLPESQQKEIAEGEAQMEKLRTFKNTLTIDNIDELCEKVAGSEAVVNVDWSSDWVEYSTTDESGSSSGGMRMSDFKRLFPDDTPRIHTLGYGISGGGEDGKLQAQISVLRMNKEGVITCALYVPKDLEL